MASAASTAPTNPLVSTIPRASKGISCILTFIVVEIKVDVRFAGANLSLQARRIKRRHGFRVSSSKFQVPSSLHLPHLELATWNLGFYLESLTAFTTAIYIRPTI